jgi:hypothetical protein
VLIRSIYYLLLKLPFLFVGISELVGSLGLQVVCAHSKVGFFLRILIVVYVLNIAANVLA